MTSITGTQSGRISGPAMGNLKEVVKKHSVQPRCRITDIQLATAQLAWKSSLQLDAVVARVHAAEDVEMTRAGLKKPARRAKRGEVLAFRNAIVAATIRAHERHQDTREFVVRALLPSHDHDTWGLVFANESIDVYRHDKAIVKSGLCQVLSSAIGGEPKNGAYEDLCWSIRPVAYRERRYSCDVVDICGIRNVSSHEEHADHQIDVWFERRLKEDVFDHMHEPENEKDKAPHLVELDGIVRMVEWRLYQPSLTIHVSKSSSMPYHHWHRYSVEPTSNADDVQRAAKIVSYVNEYTEHAGPKAVLRLLRELGHSPLIESP